MNKNQPNIAIVGAGVVGMTVANLLQEQLSNVHITIIADKLNQDTTSCVAAGIFRPGTSFRGPTKEITKRWIDDSWYYWENILKTNEAPDAGIMALSSYILSEENRHLTRNHLIEDLVPIYRTVDVDELRGIGPQWKYGSFFSTVKIECTRYLPWVERIFIKRGGIFSKRNIDCFASLSNFDLVFNCSGLGAKLLCSDHDLVAIRGQVTVVKAPWIKTAFYGDLDAYVIPGFDGMVTLGGVRQYDSYNLNFCKYDAAAILERCCDVVPSLRNSEIVGHKVGLRPHRVPVRVEAELIDGVRVVHCYGHGGYGVTCAPGTAMQAVDMGLNLWRSNIRSHL